MTRYEGRVQGRGYRAHYEAWRVGDAGHGGEVYPIGEVRGEPFAL